MPSRLRAPGAQPETIQQNGAIKPLAAHSGWIIQVGALDERSPKPPGERLDAAHSSRLTACSARLIRLFTEPVVSKGDRKLFRARFAGLERDQAEAVCRTAETLRDLLHHRQELTGVKTPAIAAGIKVAPFRKSARCKPLVKILRLKLCGEGSTTPDNGGRPRGVGGAEGRSNSGSSV